MSFRKIIKASWLFTDSQVLFLESIPELVASQWMGSLPRPPWAWGDQTKREAFKAELAEALCIIQDNRCAYCGLKLKETSQEYIEHIAPRARYPEFMYTNNNLAMACSYCNGFGKKERAIYSNTIDNYHADYSRCTFNIIHPYFDIPSEHIEAVPKDGSVYLHGLTNKGKRTIEVFKLDTPGMIEARTKDLAITMKPDIPNWNDLINQAIVREYTI